MYITLHTNCCGLQTDKGQHTTHTHTHTHTHNDSKHANSVA